MRIHLQVKQKQRRAKPIEDLHKTQAHESYEPPAEQQQQPSRSMPPAQQEESRPVETKPAPWAKAAPTAKPGVHAGPVSRKRTIIALFIVKIRCFCQRRMQDWSAGKLQSSAATILPRQIQAIIRGQGV